LFGLFHTELEGFALDHLVFGAAYNIAAPSCGLLVLEGYAVPIDYCAVIDPVCSNGPSGKIEGVPCVTDVNQQRADCVDYARAQSVLWPK
jgi:hypothetical protein